MYLSAFMLNYIFLDIVLGIWNMEYGILKHISTRWQYVTLLQLCFKPFFIISK